MAFGKAHAVHRVGAIGAEENAIGFAVGLGDKHGVGKIDRHGIGRRCCAGGERECEEDAAHYAGSRGCASISVLKRSHITKCADCVRATRQRKPPVETMSSPISAPSSPRTSKVGAVSAREISALPMEIWTWGMCLRS